MTSIPDAVPRPVQPHAKPVDPPAPRPAAGPQVAAAPPGWGSASPAAPPAPPASAAATSTFAPASTATPLFAQKPPAVLTVAAPFADLARKARAGLPDPPPPIVQVRSKEYVEGVKVTTPEGPELDAAVRVRGHYSLTECTFPKLTLKLDKADPDFPTSTFAESARLKIGTHCRDPLGSADELTPQGLLVGEKAPAREALAHDLYRVIEPEFALRARPARITYVDTSATAEPVPPKERAAFIFEHPSTAADRLGLPRYERTVDGKRERSPALDESETQRLTGREFSRQRTLRIALFQAMIGNWDFSIDPRSIKQTGGLRNADVLMGEPKTDGSRELIPVPADFDRATMISGKALPPRGTGGPSGATPLTRQALAYVRENVKGYKKAELKEAKAFFNERKWDLLTAVRMAHVDEDGRQLAFDHLQAFYEALSKVVPD